MAEYPDRRLRQAQHLAGSPLQPLLRAGAEKRPRYDPARAKKLLAEAGYQGQPIKITTNSRFAVMNDVAVLVQAMAQQVGINITVEVVEFATQLSRYFKGDYQLMVFNYTPYLDPLFGLDRFIGDKTIQADRVWGHPQAIALLAQLAQTSSPEERQPLFDVCTPCSSRILRWWCGAPASMSRLMPRRSADTPHGPAASRASGTWRLCDDVACPAHPARLARRRALCHRPHA